MENKNYKMCGCECKNHDNKTNIRKCKKCKFEGEVSIYFYKTGKLNSYRHTCKKCYSERNSKNRDKDIEYYQNDFDELPKKIKIQIVSLYSKHKNIKKIARDVKCKYNMLWYAHRAKQIENFAIKYNLNIITVKD